MSSQPNPRTLLIVGAVAMIAGVLFGSVSPVQPETHP